MKIIPTFITILLMASIVLAEGPFKYDSKGKRDPFVPLVSETGVSISDIYGISSIKDIRLEGIVWDDKGGSIAIINGEIIKEGEVLGVLKLLKIQKDGVVFDIDGEEVKVDLMRE
jgi:hypothetical protein